MNMKMYMLFGPHEAYPLDRGSGGKCVLPSGTAVTYVAKSHDTPGYIITVEVIISSRKIEKDYLVGENVRLCEVSEVFAYNEVRLNN